MSAIRKKLNYKLGPANLQISTMASVVSVAISATVMAHVVGFISPPITEPRCKSVGDIWGTRKPPVKVLGASKGIRLSLPHPTLPITT